MSKPTKELDKWQFVFTKGDAVEFYVPFMRQLTVGIFKLTSLPKEGVRVDKDNYDGFLWSWYYWFPIRRTKP